MNTTEVVRKCQSSNQTELKLLFKYFMKFWCLKKMSWLAKFLSLVFWLSNKNSQLAYHQTEQTPKLLTTVWLIFSEKLRVTTIFWIFETTRFFWWKSQRLTSFYLAWMTKLVSKRDRELWVSMEKVVKLHRWISLRNS